MVRLLGSVRAFHRGESTVFKTIAIDHSATSPCCSEDSFAGVAALSIVFFAEVKYHPDAHGENRDQPPDIT